jgi:DNA-binding NarL/FixJ family response regulator
VRVLIADANALFRAALMRLIEIKPGFEVAGEASGSLEAVNMTRRLQPDVLLLDIDSPGHGALDALRQLHRPENSCRSIIFASRIANEQLIEALRAGARGVMMKAAPVELLFKGIAAVMAGEYWVGRERVPDLVRTFRSAPEPNDQPCGLTTRELQVVQGVITGDTNKEIARRLGISPNTAKHHLANIFDKVSVSNRLELALFARNHRILRDRFESVQ